MTFKLKAKHPLADTMAMLKVNESFVHPTLTLKEACQLCDNAARYFIGLAFVAHIEGKGVRIWRTM